MSGLTSNYFYSFFFVFLGGGVGASLRFALSLIAVNMNRPAWISTLVANLFGTLLYFLTVKWALEHHFGHQIFLRIGLFGSLTTFSTLSFEVFSFIKSGHYSQAALVFSLNVFAGVLIAIGVFR